MRLKLGVKSTKKQGAKSAKRILGGVLWWKLVAGAGLIGLGIFLGSIYLKDLHNMIMGVLSALTIAPGCLLIYTGLKQGEAGYTFKGKGRKYTGQENAILILAKYNSETKKDIPLGIDFFTLKKIPKGARLHYVRNLRKHFYELFNNTTTKKLEPVKLPDKPSFPPELFRIPATMQPYKDYMDFSPPSLLQKVAPGILLLAMGIVGILMVMTTGG